MATRCQTRPAAVAREVCLAPGGTVPDRRPERQLRRRQHARAERHDRSTAFQTPVDDAEDDLLFAGLAICPAGDKDNYSVTITDGDREPRDAHRVRRRRRRQLQGSILNSGGTPIANAAPMTACEHVRAYTPNLPTGVYYAQVYGPTSGALHDEQLQADDQRHRPLRPERSPVRRAWQLERPALHFGGELVVVAGDLRQPGERDPGARVVAGVSQHVLSSSLRSAICLASA